MTDAPLQDAIVRLTDIRLSLRSAAGPVDILRGVSLAVEHGRHVAIVGPSGSGKSSLLAIIGGLERPTAGRVEIEGQDLSALDEDLLARFRGLHVGIVFQSFHLVPTMTAAENVALPLELAGESDAGPRAQAALERVGLAGRSGHLPAELSGGEQQRVAMARALIARPRLLLADEPTGNLDSHTGETIANLLFDAAEDAGATLVLVTHNPELAARCHDTIAIEDGRIAGQPA